MESYNRLTKNRQEFLESLYNLIVNSLNQQKETAWEYECNRPVQRIFVNAPWGMGKTLFAKALKERCIKENHKDNISYLYLNAWSMDFYGDPLKALIAEMSEEKVITVETVLAAKEFLKNIGKVFFGKILKNMILKKFNLSEQDIEEIKSFFDGIDSGQLEEYKEYKKLLNEFKACLSKDEIRKLIVIDELDRCRPDYAIEFLEVIKHIFDVKNTVFLFLVNKEQLASIVSNMYMSCTPNSDYFEKFYDIELNLPDVDYKELVEKEFRKYNSIDEYNKTNYQTDFIMNKIFLEMLMQNNQSLISEKIGIRRFQKLLQEFEILKNSLSIDEKRQLSLVYISAGYFIYKKSGISKSFEEILPELIKNEKIRKIFKTVLKDTKIYCNYEKEKFYRDLKTNIYKVEFKEESVINLEMFDSFCDSEYKDSIPVYIYENDILEWCEKKYNFVK
ncbi:KAP family P-loop NTPase fold protein [Fusobacterium necrophorum]|uniref:KAP family P-loop NTPase fold protein n=1 Tax=Fusobacterium necrophorum TaxID=859 RepID=UPI00370F2FBB